MVDGGGTPLGDFEAVAYRWREVMPFQEAVGEPDGTVHLALPPGDYEILIDAPGFHPHTVGDIPGLAWNGPPIRVLAGEPQQHAVTMIDQSRPVVAGHFTHARWTLDRREHYPVGFAMGLHLRMSAAAQSATFRYRVTDARGVVYEQGEKQMSAGHSGSSGSSGGLVGVQHTCGGWLAYEGTRYSMSRLSMEVWPVGFREHAVRSDIVPDDSVCQQTHVRPRPRRRMVRKDAPARLDVRVESFRRSWATGRVQFRVRGKRVAPRRVTSRSYGLVTADLRRHLRRGRNRIVVRFIPDDRNLYDVSPRRKVTIRVRR